MIRPDMIALIHHLVERAIFRKCRDEVREAGILDVDLIDRDRFVILPDQTLDVETFVPIGIISFSAISSSAFRNDAG